MRPFIKSQFTSFAATSVDFVVTIFLTELIGISYLVAHSIGMTAGGATQFSLNRTWTFRGGQNSVQTTLFRYLMAWTLGFLLSLTGVFVLTHYAGINYIISKVIVSAVLSVTINFYLHKKYVFK